MFADKFKKSKELELSKAIKTYVQKNYDMNAVSNIDPLCRELDFARSEAIKCSDLEKTSDSMKKCRTNILNYLRLLAALKQRMNFGNDDSCVKITFTWTDVLKNSNYSSNQYAHEYYNNLFNLAVSYVNSGKTVNFTDSDEDLKEAIKNFNQAAWLFDKIKQETATHIPAKDLQPDFNSVYLTYCSTFCIAQSQALIFEVSGRKNMNLELQAQLSRGIFDFLTSCLNFTNDGLKNYSDANLRTYLNNRRYWYFALGLLKMKDFTNEEFKSRATGFGKMIAYTSLAKDALTTGCKDIKNIHNLIDSETYTNKLRELENDITIMREKNRKIYYDGEPNPSSLPKIEKKVMAKPVPLTESLNASTQYNDALKDLIPREVKTLIENYKEKMMGYISEKLSKLENECKIDKYLLDLGLPGTLESALCQNQISDYLWNRINEVQTKGGALYINSIKQTIDCVREEASKKLNNVNVILLNEEEQDNQFRNMYGIRWTREPSAKINYNYLGAISNLSAKIEAAKKCDEQVDSQIKENMKYFELLSLSRQALEKKIPVKVDENQLLEAPEAKSLKEDLDKLSKLKEENKQAIEKVFNELNEESVISFFLDVHRKKASEIGVFEQQTKKFDALLEEISKLDVPITNLKNEIKNKNDLFLKIKDVKLKPKPENEQYFKDLESYCSLFNEKLNALYQGSNFYTALDNKIDELYGNVSDYILSRDLEKNDLLKQQKGGYVGATVDFTKHTNNTHSGSNNVINSAPIMNSGHGNTGK